MSSYLIYERDAERGVKEGVEGDIKERRIVWVEWKRRPSASFKKTCPQMEIRVSILFGSIQYSNSYRKCFNSVKQGRFPRFNLSLVLLMRCYFKYIGTVKTGWVLVWMDS